MQTILPLLSLITISILPTVVVSDENLCLPTNWNYAWSRVGDVWFTRTREKGKNKLKY